MSAQPLEPLAAGPPSGIAVATARVRELQSLIALAQAGASPVLPAPAQGYAQAPGGPAGGAFAAALAGASGSYEGAQTQPQGGPSGSGPYDSLVRAAAARYGLDPALLHGLIEQESGFDPGSHSSAGALGLTQLMPETAASLGVSDPLDPAQSIDGGARYLSRLLREFGGNQVDALAAYNAGPGAVRRYGGVPPYPETQSYVSKVLGYATAYRGAGAGATGQAAAQPLAQEAVRAVPLAAGPAGAPAGGPNGAPAARAAQAQATPPTPARDGAPAVAAGVTRAPAGAPPRPDAPLAPRAPAAPGGPAVPQGTATARATARAVDAPTSATQPPIPSSPPKDPPRAATDVEGSATTAQPAASSPPAQPQAPVLGHGVDLQHTIEALRATVAIAVRQGAAQARIALQPQELGDVRIHLTQTADGLFARLTTQTAAAAQALADGHVELRHSLSSLGVSLLRLDVGSFEQHGAHGGRQQLSDQPGAPRSSRPADADADAADASEPATKIDPASRPRALAGAGLVDVLA